MDGKTEIVQKTCQKKKRKKKKIVMLFCVIFLTSVILVVETIAWFIGTAEATVSSFEIGISSGESLKLSLDGEEWSDTLTISEENVTGSSGSGQAYAGNTNHWAGENGLIPMSTNGDIDTESSRMKFFGKSSLSATEGGFRLMSNRIDNSVSEQDGYVAFDLFIKNGSGTAYIEEYNEADDEDIYLTTTSKVASQAGGSTDYGLANSVRVAFAQIGRVAATTEDPSDITSISCGAMATNTKLCDEVKTTIWEPNDTKHDTKLISYFSKVCKKKTGPGEYTEEACDAITDGTATPTYVVKEEVSSSDNIDVYDGLNGYSGTTKLEQSQTFTDTMKNLTEQNRPTFFKLAPNSITKIRVYIYLEGQDVDNYDLISLGKKISVQFGFTKDQMGLTAEG